MISNPLKHRSLSAVKQHVLAEELGARSSKQTTSAEDGIKPPGEHSVYILEEMAMPCLAAEIYGGAPHA